ncbi:MAG: FtsX-like permease family protein, partial [Nocardioides sp.]
MTSSRLKELLDSLANQGVARMPRDAMLHPEAWGVAADPAAFVDSQALAAGALAIAIGSMGVVLVVGSAFAVSARRNVRALGLLISNGGGPADLRRLVLAQGLLLGAGASFLGALCGIAAFVALAPEYERVTGQLVWGRTIEWVSILGLVALGSLTAVVAAALPAWTVSRLTPLAAIAGHFPARHGGMRSLAFAAWAVGAGLLTLFIAALWIGRTFSEGDPPPTGRSFRPIALGGIGLLNLGAASVLCAPHVMRILSLMSERMSVNARLAGRDAARRGSRTVAAAVAVAAALALGLLSVSIVSALTERSKANPDEPPQTLTVSLDDGSAAGVDTEQVATTVEGVLGPIIASVAYRAHLRGRPTSRLEFKTQEGLATEIRVADEATLRTLVGPLGNSALTVFRRGGMVTTERFKKSSGRRVTATVATAAGKELDTWELVAVTVSDR